MMSKSLKTFESQILFFNGMYKLALAPFPTASAQIQEMKDKTGIAFPRTDQEHVEDRLRNFKSMLAEEVNEVDDITLSIISGYRYKDGEPVNPVEEYKEIDFLTDMADWLGDIQVYCASEMARYGIPVKETTDIIMQSNFSKLGEDGKPIYDGRGKVQKGPGYWKPEPKIKEMLLQKIEEHHSPSNTAPYDAT